MAMAANKVDAVDEGTHQRAIPKEQAKAVAEEHSMHFEETSAKTGKGVVELFGEIA